MWSSTQETVDILDLRHYTSADLRPLLDRESEVWASGMAWDYRSSAEMILRYIDSKILPGYTAIENGRVVGYTFFVYEGTKGVIGDLFVSANGVGANASRDDEVRMRLLTHAIETLQQTPGVRRIEAQLLAPQIVLLIGRHLLQPRGALRIFIVGANRRGPLPGDKRPRDHRPTDRRQADHQPADRHRKQRDDRADCDSIRIA